MLLVMKLYVFVAPIECICDVVNFLECSALPSKVTLESHFHTRNDTTTLCIFFQA
jgi:hypothetical protein